MAALTAGAKAPDFTLPQLEGPDFSLAKALDRGPVLLAFFKISCPVCQYTFPFLERLYQSLRDQDAALIGVSQNSVSDTARFRKEYGITFPLALDDPAAYKVSNAYGLTIVPTMFLIAPSGTLEVSSAGWSRSDIAGVAAKIADALHTVPPPVFLPGEEVAEWRPG